MKSGMVRPENDSVLLPMARFGIELIAKERIPSSKRLCPICSMARFRHRRFNAKRMVRSENDSVLLPMARFGIESIVKKDGYPSQNDFALSPKGTD